MWGFTSIGPIVIINYFGASNYAPVGCMNERTAMTIANSIGKLVGLDSSNDFFGKFIRMKVLLDINLPLKLGVRVMFEGETMWLPIKYESLPIYCYGCGIIGHSFKACSSYSEFNSLNPNHLPFGPTIKASPKKNTRTDMPKPASLMSHSPVKSSSPTSQTSINSKLDTNDLNRDLHITSSQDPCPHKSTLDCELAIVPYTKMQKETSNPYHVEIPNAPPIPKSFNCSPSHDELSLKCQKHESPHSQDKTQNPKNRAWKRLARESSKTVSGLIHQCLGKRLSEADNIDETIDLPDLKRLRVLDTNIDIYSMEIAAEAPREEPRRSQ